MISFLLSFLPKPYMHTSSLPCMHARCSAHFNLIDLVIQITFDEYKLWTTSLGIFFQIPITWSFLGQNILLSALFSNTFSWCSLNVRDLVSHSYKTVGKIIVLYILIFVFRQQAIRHIILNWMEATQIKFIHSFVFALCIKIHWYRTLKYNSDYNINLLEI
jgi:hypothetical protein